MENFLNNCISSLVVSDELMDAQEIIIVNDGSKDNTLKIATDWANKFQNSIRIIDKKKWKLWFLYKCSSEYSYRYFCESARCR